MAKVTNRIRERWLTVFEDLVVKAGRQDLRQAQDFWDTGIFLFNQGLSPMEAAQRICLRPRR